jgi:hypothetical protein
MVPFKAEPVDPIQGETNSIANLASDNVRDMQKSVRDIQQWNVYSRSGDSYWKLLTSSKNLLRICSEFSDVRLEVKETESGAWKYGIGFDCVILLKVSANPFATSEELECKLNNFDEADRFRLAVPSFFSLK